MDAPRTAILKENALQMLINGIFASISSAFAVHGQCIKLECTRSNSLHLCASGTSDIALLLRNKFWVASNMVTVIIRFQSNLTVVFV